MPTVTYITAIDIQTIGTVGLAIKFCGFCFLNVQALASYEVETARDALEPLFRIEDSFGLEPTAEGALTLDPKAKGAQKLSAAIKAWESARTELSEGKISQDEYDEWRASFKA